ncbi:MAG: hypothetical protein SGARI_007650, partial [Bacillariaceae sp.]
MFFGKTKESESRPSAAEETSPNDDWHHIVPNETDSSFEVIDNVVNVKESVDKSGGGVKTMDSNRVDDAPKNSAPTPPGTTSTEGEENRFREIMEDLEERNSRFMEKHYMKVFCLFFFSIIVKEAFYDNKNNINAIPEVVKMEEEEEHIPFPAYDAFIAVPRAGEPVGQPDVNHFQGMKSHELQQHQMQLQQMQPPSVDYAAFVAAQRSKNGGDDVVAEPYYSSSNSVSPRPAKPSAVPLITVQGSMKSRKRRSMVLSGAATNIQNNTGIPSVGDPRPPEQYPEHDDDDYA